MKRKVPQLKPAAMHMAGQGTGVVFGICVLLAAMVWLVFGQTLGHEFLNYDDMAVYDNPAVAHGPATRGIAWAFTHIQIGHWDPLTTISHMLDSRIFGTWAGGHHLTNVLLHGATAVLLFLALRQMTGALWRSAFVAAVFAVHPLRVESVAWVTERKDVLSGVFFMLTLLAYASYAHHPRSSVRYLAVLLLFAAGLLSKSMLVTLPFILLLLDYWPLGRWASQAEASPRHAASVPPARSPGLLRLILEKVPFFALSAVACVVQMAVNQKGIIPIEKLPLAACIANALVSCMIYIQEMVYPAGLAVLYPHPGTHLPMWQALFAGSALALISGAVFVWRRKFPFLAVGWLWYLVMLAPVIGVIQAGMQAHADRYTYLPQIGLYIAITWLCADWCAGLRHGRVVSGLAAVAILCALTATAFHQVSYWRDSVTLWSHAVDCTQDNPIARNNLGNALARAGRTEEAAAQWRKALEINPSNASASYSLGVVLAGQGHIDEAVAHFREAMRIDPNYAEAYYNLGNALLQQGHLDEAVTQWREALRIKPDYADARYNLGKALLQMGQTQEAIAQTQRALELQPDDTDIENNLAWMLATASPTSLRDAARALELATKASKASGDNDPVALDTLAAAYAGTGQFAQAVQTAKKALQLAEAKSDSSLAGALRREIKLYEAGLPFQDEP